MPDFPETADIETSSEAYAARFNSPSGQWMLGVQETITLRLLRDAGVRSVLDVGGGHGQLAGPLAREKFDVTVLGSAPSCAHRVKSLTNAGAVKFVVGNVIELPFPDQSFDATLAFRLVMHCERWPQLIRELCRVARTAVIIDYPTRRSLNAVAPLLFGAKKRLEGDTREWTLFSNRQIKDEFEKSGFHCDAHHGQFFFPMVLHRVMNAPCASKVMEAITSAVGLNRLLGSPVIVRMTRRHKPD